MRLVLIAILSSLCGSAASVLALLVLSFNQQVSGEDITGVAIFSFAPALVMCLLLYIPSLFWLRKRRGERAGLFAFACAIVLNIPAFIVLTYSALAGGFFGEGEAWFFALAFAITGLVFGPGFAWHCRRSSA
ncbi:MAG: hypothetical protein AB1631_27075 [Acidobacteriota bacterium]